MSSHEAFFNIRVDYLSRPVDFGHRPPLPMVLRLIALMALAMHEFPCHTPLEVGCSTSTRGTRPWMRLMLRRRNSRWKEISARVNEANDLQSYKKQASRYSSESNTVGGEMSGYRYREEGHANAAELARGANLAGLRSSRTRGCL